MSVFPFPLPRLVLETLLILFIVIFGPPRFPVCLVLSIILQSSMTTRTTCGHFLFISNPTRSPLLLTFFSYVATQFRTTIKSVQCDNGCEFDNSSSRAFFLSHGVNLRMSCPYTSQQNGKVERVLRTVNNIIRSLLFHAHLPLSYGLRLFIPPPIFSTVTPLKPYPFPPLTRPCTVLLPTTPTSVSLAVDVIPISLPPRLINLIPSHLSVCFLDTPMTTMLLLP
jgi:hypothetical protein